jgi:hypothetical protein
MVSLTVIIVVWVLVATALGILIGKSIRLSSYFKRMKESDDRKL